MRKRNSVRTTADYERYLKEEAERQGGCPELDRIYRKMGELPDWTDEEWVHGPKFFGSRKGRKRR